MLLFEVNKAGREGVIVASPERSFVKVVTRATRASGKLIGTVEGTAVPDVAEYTLPRDEKRLIEFLSR